MPFRIELVKLLSLLFLNMLIVDLGRIVTETACIDPGLAIKSTLNCSAAVRGPGGELIKRLLLPIDCTESRYPDFYIGREANSGF